MIFSQNSLQKKLTEKLSHIHNFAGGPLILHCMYQRVKLTFYKQSRAILLLQKVFGAFNKASLKLYWDNLHLVFIVRVFNFKKSMCDHMPVAIHTLGHIY